MSIRCEPCANPREISRTSMRIRVSFRELPRTHAYLLENLRVFVENFRELRVFAANSRICVYVPYNYANMDRELSRIRRELLENFRVSARVFAYLSRTFANFRVFVANCCVSARVFSRIRRVFSRTFCELSRTLAYICIIRVRILSTAS